LETELSLEYGKDLKQRRVIHKELLCCHSKVMQDLFVKAKALEDAYSVTNRLRRQLKQFVYPNMADKIFEENHMENQVRTHV
jgi:hypothetical protein